MCLAEVSRALGAFVAALKLAPLATSMSHAEASAYIYFATAWLCTSAAQAHITTDK